MSVADSLSHTPTVLITGGAKRLGRAFCLAFAHAGWQVICHYNTSKLEALETQQLVQAQGVSCHLVQLDLSLPEAHEQLLEACQTQAKAWPTCIVNNASVFEEDDAGSCTAQHLQTHFQTNTVLPLMLGNGVGSELRQPLGVTLVGGLLVSQWLTLFTTPVIYLQLDALAQRFGRASSRA